MMLALPGCVTTASMAPAAGLLALIGNTFSCPPRSGPGPCCVHVALIRAEVLSSTVSVVPSCPHPAVNNASSAEQLHKPRPTYSLAIFIVISFGAHPRRNRALYIQDVRCGIMLPRLRDALL